MLEVSFQWDRSIQCIFPDRSRQHQRYCVFLQPLDENNRGRMEIAGGDGFWHKGRSDLPVFVWQVYSRAAVRWHLKRFVVFWFEEEAWL